MGGIEMQRKVITLDEILSEDLNLLQSNYCYEFLNFKMKMNDLKRSENTYKSKINPLFYAANMSEIYH